MGQGWGWPVLVPPWRKASIILPLNWAASEDWRAVPLGVLGLSSHRSPAFRHVTVPSQIRSSRSHVLLPFFPYDMGTFMAPGKGLHRRATLTTCLLLIVLLLLFLIV